MMLVPHRKHTYGPPQSVTGIALLFHSLSLSLSTANLGCAHHLGLVFVTQVRYIGVFLAWSSLDAFACPRSVIWNLSFCMHGILRTHKYIFSRLLVKVMNNGSHFNFYYSHDNFGHYPSSCRLFKNTTFPRLDSVSIFRRNLFSLAQ
jgi:hypothetical protein